MKRRLQQGKIEDRGSGMQAEQASAEFIQRRIRGILARRQIENMRQEEMVFLGMLRKPKGPDEIENDPIKKQDGTMEQRKQAQVANMEAFELAKDEIIQEIQDIEGNDIEELMLKERRDWI